MASLLIKTLGTINNLAPGQEKIRHWNNATPSSAVWYIQAIPLEKSFTSDTPAEIEPRVMLRFQTEKDHEI